MADLGVVLTSGLSLGVVYALLGVAVSGVAISTRLLHLAVGALVAAAVPLQLGLAVQEVTGLAPLAAALATVLVGTLVAASLTPLATVRERDQVVGLVGLVTAGAVIQAATSRWLGASTLRPAPLLALADQQVLGVEVGGASLAAVVVGLPLAVAFVGLLASPVGARFRLVGGSAAAADRIGIPLLRTRATAFALSGAAAVVAGLLVAPITFSGPAAAAGFTVRGVAAGALFGLGRPRLALLGGLAVGLAEASGATLWPAAGGDVAVALLVVVVLVRRGASQDGGRPW